MLGRKCFNLLCVSRLFQIKNIHVKTFSMVPIFPALILVPDKSQHAKEDFFHKISLVGIHPRIFLPSFESTRCLVEKKSETHSSFGTEKKKWPLKSFAWLRMDEKFLVKSCFYCSDWRDGNQNVIPSHDGDRVISMRCMQDKAHYWELGNFLIEKTSFVTTLASFAWLNWPKT